MNYYIHILNNRVQAILSNYIVEGDELISQWSDHKRYPLSECQLLDVSNWPDEIKKSKKNYSLDSDGNVQLISIEDYEAQKLFKANEVHDKDLRILCERYQHSEEGGNCNANFFALLTASKGVAKAMSVALGPKAQACIDWCDALWADYYSRKGDHTKGSDFSGHGEIPYSFTEVRAESEAL